jgi:hypothetical protein
MNYMATAAGKKNEFTVLYMVDLPYFHIYVALAGELSDNILISRSQVFHQNSNALHYITYHSYDNTVRDPYSPPSDQQLWRQTMSINYSSLHKIHLSM